jgi:hypothetical protein
MCEAGGKFWLNGNTEALVYLILCSSEEEEIVQQYQYLEV